MSGENGSIIYQDEEIPMNISARTIYEMKLDILKLRDSGARTNNELKLLSDILGITIPELERMMNQSVNLQVKNEKKENTRGNVIWIIGFIIFLIIVIGGSINLWRKRTYKKGLVEGSYNYRQ